MKTNGSLECLILLIVLWGLYNIHYNGSFVYMHTSIYLRSEKFMRRAAMTYTMNIHRCRFVDYTPHTITSIAFSHGSDTNNMASNGLRLAVGRSNGDIEIWNPKFNWTHELTLYGSRGRSIEGLCWSGDEDYPPRLFSIGGSTYVTEWDLATGLPKTNYDCNVGVIWSLAVNKSGNKLAVGSDDGTVCIIDISGGPGSLEHDMICQRQDLRVLSIDWYDDEMIIGGCADARVRCWSTSKDTKGRLLGTMRVDKSKTESTLVWSVKVLSKRKQIVSGDSTGSVKVWDLNSFTLLQSFSNQEADILCISNDVHEERFFTAGVDRKIHQYNLINSNSSKNSKWVHSYNRLLHSNDVRSMAVFESKGYNFLISGGVEKSIVIQSLSQFHDGKYRKLALAQQHRNTLYNKLQNLVVMWQDQQIKIWKVGGEEAHKLVLKVSLSDDDNITQVALNKQGNLMVVGTMTSVKIFDLSPSANGRKLVVSKYRDENFDSLASGCKKIIIYDDNKFLILMPNEEIYKFIIDREERVIELDNEIELENYEAKSTISYHNNINNIVLNEEETHLAISRFNGVIQIVQLEDLSSFKLLTLSGSPHLISFTGNDTLVVLNDDNKLVELTYKQTGKLDALLTSWSKRNSEFLPKQFLTLEEKPEGLFTDDQKVWIYGKNWISYFNLSINIPINKTYKNTASSKKRTRDGLTIEEEEEEEEDSNLNMMELSLKQTQINKIKQQEQDEDSSDKEKPFFLSFKYRPVLSVDKFDDQDLIILERDNTNLSAPAFNLPKINI